MPFLEVVLKPVAWIAEIIGMILKAITSFFRRQEDNVDAEDAAFDPYSILVPNL